MIFFLVDNQLSHLTRLQKLVVEAYAGSSVLPSKDKTYTRWSDVIKDIDNKTKRDDDLVIVLDLGLESLDISSVRSGVEQAFSIKTIRPKAVFIAYTQWVQFAQGQPHYMETFNSAIDKQRLIGFDTWNEQLIYIKQIVSSALQTTLGLKASYRFQDSIGIRLAEAALGPKVFDFLIQEVANGWENVVISSLTSGHSGAFLLLITGMVSDHQQKVIAKCAVDIDVIKAESQNVSKCLSELGPLAGVLAASDQRPHTLPNDRGYYYLQADISGDPLLDLLKKNDWSEKSKDILDGIISLELRCYDNKSSGSYGTIEANKKFVLSPIDCGRAVQSLDFLKQLGIYLESIGGWPQSIPRPEDLVLFVSSLINNWKQILVREKKLLCICQHGDLNPGNILIPCPGSVVLIDLNRLGQWPVGYDIGRLSTMLCIRLMHHENNRDWVLNNISIWFQEDLFKLDREQDWEHSICPPSAYCNKRMSEFFMNCNNNEKDVLIRGYMLGILWDLIKVISYQDLSPYKRLWVLSECWRIASVLSLAELPKKDTTIKNA